MAKFMFKGVVHHDKLKFKKGDECPSELVAAMQKLGAVEVVPEPVKPTQPEKAK